MAERRPLQFAPDQIAGKIPPSRRRPWCSGRRWRSIRPQTRMRCNSRKEDRMYAAIRQGKAKTGMAEELTRRIKEGAIPIISDVEGFMGYYVVYAPDDTVTAISLFSNFASAEEANRRAIAWIEKDLAPLLTGPATAMAGPVIVHTLA